MGKESTASQRDQRISKRFDKSFQVAVESELFGRMNAIARNISETGICIEMPEPLPLGAAVTIHFVFPGDFRGVSVRAEVKHHFCFNYNVGAEAASSRGIGLRFTEFLQDSDDAIPSKFPSNPGLFH